MVKVMTEQQKRKMADAVAERREVASKKLVVGKWMLFRLGEQFVVEPNPEDESKRRYYPTYDYAIKRLYLNLLGDKAVEAKSVLEVYEAIKSAECRICAITPMLDL